MLKINGRNIDFHSFKSISFAKPSIDPERPTAMINLRDPNVPIPWQRNPAFGMPLYGPVEGFLRIASKITKIEQTIPMTEISSFEFNFL